MSVTCGSEESLIWLVEGTRNYRIIPILTTLCLGEQPSESEVIIVVFHQQLYSHLL